jgi:hypothetical protein
VDHKESEVSLVDPGKQVLQAEEESRENRDQEDQLDQPDQPANRESEDLMANQEDLVSGQSIQYISRVLLCVVLWPLHIVSTLLNPSMCLRW